MERNIFELKNQPNCSHKNWSNVLTFWLTVKNKTRNRNIVIRQRDSWAGCTIDKEAPGCQNNVCLWATGKLTLFILA